MITQSAFAEIHVTVSALLLQMLARLQDLDEYCISLNDIFVVIFYELPVLGGFYPASEMQFYFALWTRLSEAFLPL